MLLTLREEVLVVVDYENILYGTTILKAIQARRRAINNLRHLTVNELECMLFNMVEYDNLLEAWVKPLKKKYCVRIADMAQWRGKKRMELLYRLTPAGWRAERDLEDRLLKEGFVLGKK